MIDDEELRAHLASPTDEAKIARIWGAVRERRRPGRARAGLAAGSAVALAAAAAWLLWPSAPAPGPLRGAQHGDLPSAWSASAAPLDVRFDDGSRVSLTPGARLSSIDNGPDRFVTLLERGRARFEVQPGGPRRWVVESGLATVEVVGTVFTVERHGDTVEVEVERGVVVVRGERVPDRVVRLTRGRRLRVSEPVAQTDPAPTPVPAPVPAPAPAPEAADPPALSPDSPAPRPRPPTPEPPADPAPQATPAPTPTPAPQATPAPDPTPSSVDPAVVDDLMQRASDARHRGDFEQASALLERASRTDDPRAALAAFTLGRLEMDELRRPWRARRALRRAMSLGLPERLRAQAQRRLVQLGPATP